MTPIARIAVGGVVALLITVLGRSAPTPSVAAARAASNPFGVMLPPRLAATAGGVQLARALGVSYIRPLALFADRWDGSCPACDAALSAGLKLVLTVRHGGDVDAPSLPPADLDAYRASLAAILDTYHPEVLVVENEENSALFYQGTPAEYAAQLAAACAVAHERGVPCANGGLTGGLAALLLYDHYRRAGDEARAEDFRARAFTAEQRVLLDTPRAQEQLNRGRELLARYQTVGLDYLNVHWYGADPAALVEVVEHLRAETGLPVLSNEVGQWNDDPAQTTAIMAAIVRLGLPIAVWYSVDGPRSRALVEPDGTLRPTGRAFQAFIARGMGEAPPSENPWGVSFGALVLDPARTPRALELAAAAGIGWVRFTFGYSRIARPDGDYVFTPYDALVAKAHAEGLQVLGTLGLATEWNTTAPPGAPDLIRYPPRDEDAFAEYVAHTVAHYPDIRYWELWNEPDLPGYWHGTPAQYARLLARTYQAVKQANPAAQVVLGGLALGGQRVNPDFLAALLADPDYPAARFFDVMNFHFYGSRAEAARRMSVVRDTLARFGAADKPIWVTKAGYPSDPREQTGRQFQGAEGQADWLRDRLPYLLELGAERVFWFKLLDTEADAGAVSYGLLDRDATPKPAYEAYRELIAGRRARAIPHPQPSANGSTGGSDGSPGSSRTPYLSPLLVACCPRRAVPTGGEVVSHRPRRGRCSPHRLA